MAMIKCEEHGLSMVTLVCQHIGDSIDTGASRPASVVLDEWGQPYVACDECTARHNREGKNNAASAESRYSLTREAEPYCTACVRAWFDKSPALGALSEAVKTAKDRENPDPE